MSRPLILISNDDGIHAPGLVALGEALEELGEVVVVAPERERSAVSHSITLHKPLRLREVRPNWYSCSGTPADCMYMGLFHVLGDRTPDLVASGINCGYNLGDDVIYSGTCAGAREAALGDVQRAVAFSAAPSHKGDFAPLARNARSFCAQFLERDGIEGGFLNVNYPPGATEDVRWRLATLGTRTYGRHVTVTEDPRGRPYYWIGGEFLGFGDVPGSDCNAVMKGEASVTAVRLRATHAEAQAEVAAWPAFNKATP